MGNTVFRLLKQIPLAFRMAFSGFYSFQDFGIEPFLLDFTLYSLLLQKEVLIKNTIECFIPGVNYIIAILKYKCAVPGGFMQGRNKLLFV